MFCGIFQSQLVRHMKTKHCKEPAVKYGLTLPQQEREGYFHNLRKKGIFDYNMKLIGSGEKDPKLLRQRNQGKGAIKICQNCNGFYSREYFFEHARHCKVASKTETAEVTGISVDTLSSANLSDGDSDFLNILESFQLDENGLGMFCKENPMIVIIGKNLYAKYKGKKIRLQRERRQ